MSKTEIETLIGKWLKLRNKKMAKYLSLIWVKL